MDPEKGFNYSNLDNIRLDSRNGWEKDFEKNYKTFTQELASNIANQAFEEMKATLQNPYQRAISVNDRFIKTISLDITENAGEILKFAPKGKELSPFKEWFEHMSETRADKEYFNTLMGIVADIAAKNINKYYKHCYCDKCYCDKSEYLYYDAKKIDGSTLRIELWRNTKERSKYSPSDTLHSSHYYSGKPKVSKKKSSMFGCALFSVVTSAALLTIGVGILIAKEDDDMRWF